MIRAYLEKIKHFNLYEKRIFTDYIVLAALIIITAIFLHETDASEVLFHYSREHEYINLDEFILTIAISSLYMFIFTLKKFFDLKKAIHDANTDHLMGIFNRRKGSELINK